MLWHCWLGDRNDIRPVKKSGCWFVGGDDLTAALHGLQLQLAPLTTSVILSSNKIQNGDILGFVQPAYFYGDHARLVWERVKLLSASMKRCST